MEIINSLEETFGGELPEDVLPRIETSRQVAEAIVAAPGCHDASISPGGDVTPIDPSRTLPFRPDDGISAAEANAGPAAISGLPNPYFSVREGVARGTLDHRGSAAGRFFP